MSLARRTLPALLFAVASATVFNGVQAEPIAPPPLLTDGDSFRPYVYGGTIYHSNPFLVPNKATARSRLSTTHTATLINRIGAGLQIAWPISLQTLRFAGWVERNRYQHFSVLSHTAANAELGLDWKIGRLWNGTVETSYSRGIANYQEFQNVAKNVWTQRSTSAKAGLRFLPDWQWVVGAHRRSKTFKKQATLDRVQNTGFTELDYDSPVNSRIGLRAEITKGDLKRFQRLPNGTLLNNNYIEAQYSLVLGVEGSEEVSYLTGRIGFTQRRYVDQPERNFSGPTARLSYLWRVTPNTRLRVSGWRELQSQNNAIPTFLVAQGFGLEPEWQATVKTRVRAFYSYQTRNYQGSSVSGDPNAGRKDKVTTFGVGIDYAFLPDLRLSLDAMRMSRGSNRPARKFDYNRVFAGVTYEFF